jgi:hypothetical protein
MEIDFGEQFRKFPNEISQKSTPWQPSCLMHRGRHNKTDTFYNCFADAPKIISLNWLIFDMFCISVG